MKESIEKLLHVVRILRMVTLPPNDISGRRMYDEALKTVDEIRGAHAEHVCHLFRREHPAMSYTAGQLYVGTFTTFAEAVDAARSAGGGRFDLAISRGAEVAWSEIEEEEKR